MSTVSGRLQDKVALEYGPMSIRAKAVTAVPTATAPLRACMQTQPVGVAEHVKGLDLQPPTEPDDVAEIVLWLASEESSSVTGITVRSNIRSAAARPGT